MRWGHSHISRTEQKILGSVVPTPGFQVPSLFALPVTDEAFPYRRSTRIEGRHTLLRGARPAAACREQLDDISSPSVPPGLAADGSLGESGLAGVSTEILRDK